MMKPKLKNYNQITECISKFELGEPTKTLKIGNLKIFAHYWCCLNYIYSYLFSNDGIALYKLYIYVSKYVHFNISV